MASFMGPGWLQALSALGYAGKGYNEGADSAARRAQYRQQLQEQQRKQQMEQQLAAALFAGGSQQPLAPMGGGPQLPGGGGQMPPMGGGGMQAQPQQQRGPDLSQLAALDQPSPGGFGPQPGPPDQMARGPENMGGGMMGQIPPAGTPQREMLKRIMARDESGGRNIMQQAVPAGGGYNPSVGRVTGPSTASGPWQVTDTTWRGTQAGRESGYGRAMDAPRETQSKVVDELIDKRGLQDWTPYNKKLKADTTAFLKNMHDGLDLPADFYKPAQAASNQIINNTPVGAMGSMSLDSIVDQINRRMPDATPQVKLAAMQFLMPLMEKQAATEWDRYKFTVTQGEKREEFRQREADRAAQREDTKAWRETTAGQKDQAGFQFITRPDGSVVRANPKTGEVSPVDLPAGSTKIGGGGGPRNVPAMVLEQKKKEYQAQYGKPMPADEMQAFENKYVAQQSIERAFGGGIMGRNMVSLNTLADHVEVIEDYASALRNGDIPRINQLANTIARERGQPEVTNAQAARTVVGDELARLLTTTGGTEQDRLQMQSIFDTNASPEQQQGAFNVMRRLVGGRLTANEQQYARNDPDRKKTFVEEMLTPNSRKIFMSAVPTAAEPQGKPQASPPSGTQPQQGAAPAAGESVPLPDAYKSDPDGTGYSKGAEVWVKRGDKLVRTPGATPTAQ